MKQWALLAIALPGLGGLVIALGCAVPCVDDGFLGMQHDPACQNQTTASTGASTTASATVTSTDATTNNTTSPTTGTTGTTSPTTGTTSPTTGTTTTDATTSTSTTTSTTDTTTDASTTDETTMDGTTDAAVCGDGVLDPGEGCDDGPGNGDDKGCKLDCTPQACGDGSLGPGEGCDDGNVMGGDGCNPMCVSEACGDNQIGPGEACDDGQNGDPDDGCTDLCTLPACGDALLQPSLGETCDAGVDNKNDGACTLACKTAACGDGLVQAGVEQCDDGPANNNTAACTLACKTAACGDGLLQAGVEACDDGNVIDDDGCPATCMVDFTMTLGGAYACVLLTNGEVHCWGGNANGQLGLGNTTALGDAPGELPTPASLFGDVVVDVASAGTSTCAVLASGAVRCVGTNQYGQLGINSTTVIGDGPGELPPADSSIGKPAKALFGGGSSSCALTTDDALRCWGQNVAGELGLGFKSNNVGDAPGELPKSDLPVGFTPVQVVFGNQHICARSAAGKVRCWGGNNFGQLGYGNTTSLGDNPGELPTADVNVGGTVIDISAGLQHNCAILNTGAVRCWGNNDFGQLGLGNKTVIGNGPGEMPPTSVDLGGLATRLACGPDHTCALLDDGKVRCWGDNAVGQLGLGNTDNIGDGPGEMPPADAKIGGAALAIYGGSNSDSHCVLLAGSQLRCWGENTSGQLGIGSIANIGDNELPSSAPLTPYK